MATPDFEGISRSVPFAGLLADEAGRSVRDKRLSQWYALEQWQSYRLDPTMQVYRPFHPRMAWIYPASSSSISSTCTTGTCHG